VLVENSKDSCFLCYYYWLSLKDGFTLFDHLLFRFCVSQAFSSDFSTNIRFICIFPIVDASTTRKFSSRGAQPASTDDPFACLPLFAEYSFCDLVIWIFVFVRFWSPLMAQNAYFNVFIDWSYLFFFLPKPEYTCDCGEFAVS